MTTTVQISARTLMWVATTAVLAVAATLIVTQAWQVGAAPGDDDATFVPTPGCRAFDFRPPPTQIGPRGTALGAGETYTQQITGGVGECVGPLAIPDDAVGVAMNVTIVDPTAQSNLRLFPADLTQVPLVSNLNFSAGQLPFPNKVDVRLSPGGAINLFNQNGQVFVLGDVVGYYTNSSLKEISAELERLADSQPFTVTETLGQDDNAAETDDEVAISELGGALVELPVTPKVSGQVTVSAHALIVTVNPASPACYISDADDIEYGFQSLLGYPSMSLFQLGGNGSATYSAARVFDVVAGETMTFALVCGDGNNDQLTFAYAPTLIAEFTPAPAPLN